MIERFVARARRVLETTPSGYVARVRRDLGMFFGPLLGERPSPTIARERGHRPVDLTSRSRRLRVAEVIRETDAAVTIRFAQPVGAPIAWEAGQFLTLVMPSPAGPLRRAYSISVPPWRETPTDPCVTIKRVEGGRVSSQLVDHAAVGQWYEVRGPSGQFTYRSGEAPSLVLIGGGSGVTPLVSILEEALREPECRVRFVYANRRREDTIFRARLDKLAEAHPERLTLRHVLESEGGRLDGERLARELDGAHDAPVYSCGPEGLMDAVSATMRGLGREALLREERFASLGAQRSRALPVEPQGVTYRSKQGALEVAVGSGETLLEAGLRAGVPMAFSCTMGGCGACRVRLLRGEVLHDEPNGLSAAEREAGQVFACIARPLGPCELEVPK